MARSSLLAIMSTWASYTGQQITWEQAFHSDYVLAPETLAMDAEPPTRPDEQGNYPLPVPGITRLVSSRNSQSIGPQGRKLLAATLP